MRTVLQIFARRDDFLSAKLAARSHVGQVGNLRRIGNPPAGIAHNSGETNRNVGQAILPAAAFQAALSAHARASKRRLKAGCSQDWLPHIASPQPKGRGISRKADYQSAAGWQPAPHGCASRTCHRENRRGIVVPIWRA